MGAWIEINITDGAKVSNGVAPLVGAWIEIDNGISANLVAGVAPLVGAWIEILFALSHRCRWGNCRSSRGSVD